MSYKADVFNVMIATPGDVASERIAIRDIIYKWNAVHSKLRSIALLPVGWETHSSPEMGAPPQEIINKQVLDKCDLLVGVFWTRIGTPTGTYPSGSVEEIEKHISAGKPVMLYFSSRPVQLDSVDAEQYNELKKFRESCKNRGLLEQYDDPIEFREKFSHQLQLKLNEHPMFLNAGSPVANAQVIEMTQRLPRISREAQLLLKEGSTGKGGYILYSRYLGGSDISVDGKTLISGNDRREFAKWESALTELINSNLILDRTGEGQVFELTNQGYQLADTVVL